jgi:WD40 repeat protein
MARHINLGGWLLLTVGVGLPPADGPRPPAVQGPKERASLRGHTNDVFALAFTADGKKLASGSRDKTIRLWDPATGKERPPLKGHTGPVTSVAITPDDKTLVSGANDRTVKLWDLTTGKERATLRGYAGRVFLAITEDGRTLASGSEYGGKAMFWDLQAGAVRATLDVGTIWALALTGDGRTLAWASRRDRLAAVTLWDPTTGRERAIMTGHRNPILCLAFTPDSKTLASGSIDRTVKLWEVATGKERATLSGHAGPLRCLAFAADGKTLASGGCEHEELGELKLWDMARGEERATLKRDADMVWAVAFTPDGKTLAAAEGPDTTIRLWDVSALTRAAPPPAPRLEDKQLDQLWADLAGADASRAFRAIWALAAAAPQTVPWLGERLRPVLPADPRRVARLIAGLDSEEFATRERAARELEALGESAGPALRKAVAGGPSAEVRRRVAHLLDQVDRPASSPERLRVLRAIEVLEHSATPEARRVLGRLAGGMPGARVTEEAKRSLHRLAKQRNGRAGGRE